EADANAHWIDEGIVTTSGKMIVLDKLLQKLKSEGRKVLIFSQFTSMLHVLQDFLNLRGYKFLRLDGSTSVARRRYEIACFQNPKS
ncbi:MAG: C-terminal helicase domain-containing protein, partial [Promethearchaeia archaeon]